MVAHQAPLSLGFSRQEHWSGLPFPSPKHESEGRSEGKSEVKGKGKVKSLSCVWLLATPWTAACQAPPSMGFSRQEYWRGVPLPSPTLSLFLQTYIHTLFATYFFRISWNFIPIHGDISYYFLELHSNSLWEYSSQSPTDGHLSCIKYFAITNYTAVKCFLYLFYICGIISSG